jgi:manganese/zinc/iron transport system permease protein
MFGVIENIFADYTLRTVALGSAILGIVSGTLGSFAVLRKQSLLGDAISHSALPGIALAFLLTGSKAPMILVIGAALAGWLATLFMITITKNSRIKTDSAMGLVLSVFFGIGLVLLTFIQKLPQARQAGLESFLFGQASAMLARDVITMAILGALVLLFVILYWKEFKLLSFDREFGESMGFSMAFADILLTLLLVIAIVIGLQTVGVVLMSAMIVAPAAAARQWTDRMDLMIILAGGFGAIAGVSGALISSTAARLPTGPTIVVCISVIVVGSLFLAPNRGLFWRWLGQFKNRRMIQLETVLADLHELATQHDDPKHPHSVSVLRTMSGNPNSVLGNLRELQSRGMAREISPGKWALTSKGASEAARLLSTAELNR